MSTPLVNESTESIQSSPKTHVPSSTGPMTPETDSNSSFELKNIYHPSSRTNEAGFTSHGSPEYRVSCDEQRGLEGGNGLKDSFMLYTPDEEQAVVKRLDRRLVLFMAFLYMLSFLDRSSKGLWVVLLP